MKKRPSLSKNADGSYDVHFEERIVGVVSRNARGKWIGERFDTDTLFSERQVLAMLGSVDYGQDSVYANPACYDCFGNFVGP